MGILDGRPFDPATFQQMSEAATPGWLASIARLKHSPVSA